MEVRGRIKRYFYLAAKEATSSEMKYRHGAIIVRGGRIISKGFNHYRRTPHSMSTHAEMAALIGLEESEEKRKELARGSDLFVVRLGGRALEPLDSIWKRNSRPCPVCVEWMYRYGVRRVFYTVGQPTNRYFANASLGTEPNDNENEEMDELMAVGEDGNEISTAANGMDLDQLRRAEEEGVQEGWWVEKVDHLKEKMERLLKLDLSRYKHRQCDHDPIPYIKTEKKELALE